MFYRSKKLVAIGGAVFAVAAMPAYAQEHFVQCASETKTIHEVVAQAALNDFHGTEQDVTGLAYAFSKCLGASQNRIRVEASAAHVSEPSYKANAFLLGAGLELHLFKKHKGFIFEPMLLVGKETLPRDRSNTVLGGAVILSDGFSLHKAARTDAGISTTVTELVIDARVDFVDRRTSDATGSILTNGSTETTFYGAVAIDQEIGTSRWKLTGRAAYRTLDTGPIEGFTTLSLGLRRMNKAYTNYGWTADLGVNIGGNHYRALLLSGSLRFSGSKKI